MSDLFIPAGHRGKVACSVCGKTGYDVGTSRPSWMVAHLRGHSACPGCGKLLTLLMNGRPRTHTRCPGGGCDASATV